MKAQCEVITYAKGTDDPKKAVLEVVGKHAKAIEVFGSRVLIATAPVADKIGSVLLTAKTMDENRFQGKVGLVLKVGPTAFKYNGQFEHEGPKPKVGDWVFFRNQDTWECSLNGASCRFVLDEYIVGRVPEPDHVW